MIVYMDWEKTSFPKGGKNDDIVYCYSSYRPFCVGRRYIEVPFMKQNAKIISMQSLTLEIWKQLPFGFKKDLSFYAVQYKRQYPKLRGKHLNSYGVFLKIIHQIEKRFQYSQMENTGFSLFIRLFGNLSVYDYIRLGYLLRVKRNKKLKHPILQPTIDYTFFPYNKTDKSPLNYFVFNSVRIMDG